MSFSNMDMACYALYLLGGESKKVHIDDIVVKCFKEISPSSFSMIKYPEFPASDTVRYSLESASKKQYGSLVTKEKVAKDKFWFFTTNGINWIENNKDRLKSLGSDEELKVHRQKNAKYLDEIFSHAAYLKFLESPNSFQPDIALIADLFKCRSDSNVKIWKSRFQKLKLAANNSSRSKEVLNFLDKCQHSIDFDNSMEVESE